VTQADLLRALRDCYIPGSRQNIVDLRLVRDSALEPDTAAPGAGIRGVPPRFVARITLYAPGTDEAVNSQLLAIVENRLAGIAAISRSELTLLPALFPILIAG
jgi:hypothetical protein